jgi:hypothetical protein
VSSFKAVGNIASGGGSANSSLCSGCGLAEAELADAGNDRFIDAMVLWGDADTIKRGLQAHFAAGATHVCVQPVHADGDFAARDRMLAALADT